MNVCVLNGSPKGNYSITLQTVLYLQRKFPEYSFNIHNVGQKLRSYEKDMSDLVAALESCDMVLFSYPVYTFLAPYQLHRTIELIKEKHLDLSKKYALQISTSKHFFDITAGEYIKENCLDMGLRYVGGLYADMDDLLSEKGRKEAEDFWKYAVFCTENNIYERLERNTKEVKPGYVSVLAAKEKKQGFDTVVVTNMDSDDVSLGAMIDDFIKVYPYNVRVINIAQYPFAGGCLGCLSCAQTGKCIYRDGFDVFLRDKIQSADAIVYAFSIKDHSMGASFKRYDDRQFCNGHRTVTSGKPFGYIACGDYESESNLRTVIEGRSAVGGNFLAGVAYDALGIRTMSEKLAYALENRLGASECFYGVGGTKIFRDLIYVMRGLMKLDHKYYKEHGIYDFPQKKKGTMLKIKLVGLLISNPKIKAKMGNRMNEGMIAPYKKIIDKYGNT